jgi:hypothetical protein
VQLLSAAVAMMAGTCAAPRGIIRRSRFVDAFSYLSVLLSIILGLAITQILQGLRGIVLARWRVRIYWPVLGWVALLLIIAVQSWWAMFGLREVVTWTFPEFSVVLAQTVVLYMLAAIVLPDFGNEEVDLSRHYHEHTAWFFSLLILILLISIGKEWVFSGGLPEATNLVFHMFFITTSLIALAVRNEWYHKALPFVGLFVFLVYIGVLFVRLR